MLRISSLVIYATCLAYAMAQTTPEQINTTTLEPTTEPPTQPEQLPGLFRFSVNNNICLSLKASMTLDLAYMNTAGEVVNLNSTALDNLANVSQQYSFCQEKDSQLVLYFEILGEEAQPQYLNFTFEQSSTDKIWNNTDLTYTFYADDFPDDLDTNVTGQHTLSAIGLFSVNVDNEGSYLCNAAQTFSFNSSSIDYKINITLHVSNLQVQAFMSADKKGEFGDVSQDCASDQGNKIVPIAVGAALAGLVIVVLIAYLIGRLKSRRQNSYEALS